MAIGVTPQEVVLHRPVVVCQLGQRNSIGVRMHGPAQPGGEYRQRGHVVTLARMVGKASSQEERSHLHAIYK